MFTCQGHRIVYVRRDEGVPMVNYGKYPPEVAITREERVKCELKRGHNGQHSARDSQGYRHQWRS
jgi:hypothetical protein